MEMAGWLRNWTTLTGTTAFPPDVLATASRRASSAPDDGVAVLLEGLIEL